MKKAAPLIFFLGLSLGLNLYFRVFPIYFPQLKKAARDAIENGIKQAAAQDVYKKFPQYDPLAKERLLASRISEYKKHNKQTIRRQIHDLYQNLKSKYQHEDGQTYLMELDCWHYARYTEHVFRHGYPGDEIVDGKMRDNFMLAPHGSFLYWDTFLFYLSAFLYKCFSLL